MNLSEEQNLIIQSKSPYIQVIAAAGSGKTTTMVELLVFLLTQKDTIQEEILVVTFTSKASQELKERLEKKAPDHKIKIHTFHAYSLSVLQRYHPDFEDKRAEIITPEDKEKVFKDLLRKHRFIIGGIPFPFLLSESNQYFKTEYPELYKEVQSEYKLYKKVHKKLDFEDFIQIYLNGLKNNEVWAQKAKGEIKRIIIDEFQDTDLTQLEWIQILNPDFLTVVGDDWQAIYGFRGATVEPFLKFREYFPNSEIFFLSTNYRSLKDVVDISCIPIQKNSENIPKKVKSIRRGNSHIFQTYLNSEMDWKILRDNIYSRFEKENPDLMILCRTNYRIQKLIQLGFPPNHIMTIHKSKGLEFHTVFVDLFDGWTGHESKENRDLSEERRILYVAMSRAKNHLILLGKEKPDEKSLEKEFLSYFRKRMPKLSLYPSQKLLDSLFKG